MMALSGTAISSAENYPLASVRSLAVGPGADATHSLAEGGTSPRERSSDRRRVLPAAFPAARPLRDSQSAAAASSTPFTVSKKLKKTARYFKNLGTLGFWSQLVCTTISAGILSFSAVATGDATAPFTFIATSVGIIAAFISVFRSFGYIRLSERLRRAANEPAKAPPRADVVKNLRNSIMFNVVGMGAAVLGLQATVGALVAKALATSSVPYYQGIPPGQSPVLALDIFLVQASANTILSHFLGLSSSLELLRSVTQAAPVPKPA
nr:protein TIC 21, chloroplastic-like isoform X3 [Setaria viridis]